MSISLKRLAYQSSIMLFGRQNFFHIPRKKKEWKKERLKNKRCKTIDILVTSYLKMPLLRRTLFRHFFPSALEALLKPSESKPSESGDKMLPGSSQIPPSSRLRILLGVVDR